MLVSFAMPTEERSCGWVIFVTSTPSPTFAHPPSGAVLLSHEPGRLVHGLPRRLWRHQRLVPHSAGREGTTKFCKSSWQLIGGDCCRFVVAPRCMLVLTFVPLAQQIVLVMSHALYVVALDVMYICMISLWPPVGRQEKNAQVNIQYTTTVPYVFLSLNMTTTPCVAF